MKTKLFLFIPLVAGVVYLAGCQKEGCTDPNAINYDANAKKDDGSCIADTTGNDVLGCMDSTSTNYNPDATVDDGTCMYDTISTVMLHAHAKLGTADFAFNTEVTNWEGRKMKFTTAQMYVSNFVFHKDGGMQMVDDSYLLLKAGTMMYEVGEIPNDHYHGFGFKVGVDSIANHADPASWPSEHALSSNNPDHAFWSWNSGFIFIKVEGMVDTTANMDGTANAPFIYHIGTDMLAKDVMFTKHEEVNADITYHINVDYLKLFDGIDLRTDPDSHTMNNMPAAMTFSGNVPDAISVQ